MSDGEPKTFGAWVRELRRRLGLTQEELGKRVGIAQGTVSAWERGENSRPHGATRARLAELAEGAGLGLPSAQEGEA